MAAEYPLERLGEALERQRRGEGAKFAIVPGGRRERRDGDGPR